MATFRAFAHRGGSHEAPENSMLAFTRALDLGFTELETDLRGTVDGVAVIHHDATLDRTTDARGRICQMTWDEVRTARIHGREPIMRLEEALAAFPNARFTLDVKDDASVAALVDAIGVRRSGSRIDLDRIVVGSFSHTRLSRVRQALPVATSASPREVLRWYVAARRGRDIQIPARHLQIPPSVGRIVLADPDVVAVAHRMGLEVHVWTIDDPESMHSLIDGGVDGLMTDRPSVLRDVLITRGLWSVGDPGSHPIIG